MHTVTGLGCGARCTNSAKREYYQYSPAQLSIPNHDAIRCARKRSDRLNGHLVGGYAAWSIIGVGRRQMPS